MRLVLALVLTYLSLIYVSLGDISVSIISNGTLVHLFKCLLLVFLDLEHPKVEQ